MIPIDVPQSVRDELVVGLPLDDDAAFAIDDLGHRRLPSITRSIVRFGSWRYVGATLAKSGRTRIQLCGRFVAELDGRRIESLLPGRQGRLLFAFLALDRLRPVARHELAQALWGDRAPQAADVSLRALLSKLRAVLGEGVLEGKSELRLVLPTDAWIDFEAASEAVHRAEAAVAQSDWRDAWWPTFIALNIARREFLQGAGGAWVEGRRSSLHDVRMRSYECAAAVGLGLGGSELASAERSARALIDAAPYRESGYRFLMEALAARGNVAEALLVYESLRRLLHDAPGAVPGAALQALQRRLLAAEHGSAGDGGRVLRTVLFIDMVDSTRRAAELGDRDWRDLVARYHEIVRRELVRFGGQEIDTAGDGVFATFDSPGEAIGCASSVVLALRKLGIDLRAGVHAGECEIVGTTVRGIAVHIGARVAAAARPGEILVSSTVKELVAGSDIAFDDRGFRVLKGVPGRSHLFAVRLDPARRPGSRQSGRSLDAVRPGG